MVLPPLELFSLREELPCCRAALSVFRWLFRGLLRFAVCIDCRLRPLPAAGYLQRIRQPSWSRPGLQFIGCASIHPLCVFARL